MMRRLPHRGFTIVELLVVISIIAVLSAILLPAVNQARESARQAQCINRIGQLAKAVQVYDASKQKFPPYVSGPEQNSPPFIFHSWIYPLLPEIEQQVTRDEIDQRVDAESPTESGYNGFWPPNPNPDADLVWPPSNPQPYDYYIRTLVCPSDPPTIDTRVGPLSYVPNTGLPDCPCNIPNGCPTIGQYCNNALVPDHRDNGVFSRAFLPAGLSPLKVTRDFISSHDGNSNTILISENVRASTWLPIYAFSVQNSSNMPETDLEAFVNRRSIVWDPAGVAGNATFNQDLQDFGNPLWGITTAAQTPSSRHSGGFSIAFCDGHVSFVSTQISYRVYAQSMTPNGRGARPPGYTNQPTSGGPETNWTWQSESLSDGGARTLVRLIVELAK